MERKKEGAKLSVGVAVISVYRRVVMCAYCMSFFHECVQYSVYTYICIYVYMHAYSMAVCACWLDRISERELVLAVQRERNSEKGGE